MIKEEIIDCPTCKGWGGSVWTTCGTCGGDGAVVRMVGIPNGRVAEVPYSTWRNAFSRSLPRHA